MGSLFAFELAEDITLSLEESIRIHLAHNHFPPVPESMVQPCVEAIQAFVEGDYNRPIELPLGVTWRGFDKSPANEIVFAHHLEAWLPDEEEV